MEQILGKTSDEKPCLIDCEAMAARLIPSEGVLPLLYPVFNLGTTIVDRNYSVRLKIRVGQDKSDTREDLSHMPFYFTDNPSGLVQAFCPLLEFNHLHLYPACGRTTDMPFQVRSDELLEAAVAGKPDELVLRPVNNMTHFTPHRVSQ